MLLACRRTARAVKWDFVVKSMNGKLRPPVQCLMDMPSPDKFRFESPNQPFPRAQKRSPASYNETGFPAGGGKAVAVRKE